MFIQLQDKSYLFKFDINALAKIEELTGKKLHQVFDSEGDMGISELRVLFFAGIKSNEITSVNQAGALMQEYIDQQGNMECIGEIIQKAFDESNLSPKK